MTERLDYGAVQDRTMPTVVYALYLLGFLTAGLTTLVGLFLAYGGRGGPDAAAGSHYTFQIRTFWLGLGWMFLACLVFAVGLPLSLILIGIPMLLLAKLMWAAGAVWYGVRTVVGLVCLSRDEAYPRPHALIL